MKEQIWYITAKVKGFPGQCWTELKGRKITKEEFEKLMKK